MWNKLMMSNALPIKLGSTPSHLIDSDMLSTAVATIFTHKATTDLLF
jgi:hypothetical protein